MRKIEIQSDCFHHFEDVITRVTYRHRDSSTFGNPVESPVNHRCLIFTTCRRDLLGCGLPSTLRNIIQFDQIWEHLGAVVHCLVSTHAPVSSRLWLVRSFLCLGFGCAACFSSIKLIPVWLHRVHCITQKPHSGVAVLLCLYQLRLLDSRPPVLSRFGTSSQRGNIDAAGFLVILACREQGLTVG